VEPAPWRTTAAEAPLEARLGAWIEDVLRPVLEDGGVDELESRLLDVSWAAYGLPSEGEGVDACVARVDAAVSACERDVPGPFALARLHSARGGMTAGERDAVDAWTERTAHRPVAPALTRPEDAPPAMRALLARACAPREATRGPTPPASASATSLPAGATPTAGAPEGARPDPLAATSPIGRSSPLRLQGPAGAPPFTARVRTAVSAGMVRGLGEDARFYDPAGQYTLTPEAGGWRIEPNPTATNETLVNGKALREAKRLAHGDVVGVGREAKGVVKLPLTVVL